MNTRSIRTTKNAKNKPALTSRSVLLTAVAAALLNSAAAAQTNSSSGINRRAAEETAQQPASTKRGNAPVTARSKAPAKRAAKTTTIRTTQRVRPASSPRAVTVTIRGNRNDVRAARQQGMQSLQNANATIAARNAEREAAAAEAAAAQAANNQAIANAQNSFNQPYNYGYIPGGLGNPIANYGYSLYGSTSTTAPVINGATPYGAPNLNFPSFYTNYSPGIYSTYSTFGSPNPFGFYGY
jgi:hypothetical protein